MNAAALARVIERSRAPVEERCELCGAPLPDTHRHLVDLDTDQVRCTCQPCALLFERPAAALGHYRLVPRRRLRLPAREAETGAPVGLAFYVVQSDGAVSVHYPGPLGATSGIVEPQAWAMLQDCWPELATLTPAVEALLHNTTGTSHQDWIVPITDCYRLVAVIREHWSGLSGGQDVWPAVEDFFAGLEGAPHG